MATRPTSAAPVRSVILAGLVVVALTLAACKRSPGATAPSSPSPQVSDLKVESDTRVIRGDFDYGVSVTFIVVNMGEPGTIRIRPWLTCSEGEWSREQHMYFNKGEAKQLTYFFAEPTINATNIQGGVRTQ